MVFGATSICDSSVMIDLANNVSGIDSFSGNVITPLHTNGVLHFDNDKFIMRPVTKEIQQLKHLRDDATFGGEIVSKRPKNLSLPTRPPKKKVKLKKSVELGKEATVEEPVLPTWGAQEETALPSFLSGLVARS